MDYADATLRRLRDRLIRYRNDVRQNGRKRTWETIANDILDADTVPRSTYDREPSFKVLGEALRRFAAGLQTPTPERLDAIAAFLIEKKFLTRDELDEASNDLAALQLLAGVFQSEDSRISAAFRRNGLIGSYVAVRTTPNRRHEYALLEIGTAGNQGFIVEETIHSTNAASPTQELGALRRFFRVASTGADKGDGVVVESHGGMPMLIMRDRLTRLATVYSVVFAEQPSYQAGEAAGLFIHKPQPFTDPESIPRLDGTKAEAASLVDRVAASLTDGLHYYRRGG